MNNVNLKKIKPLEKVFQTNTIPAAFSSSDYFAPYLGITLQSIIEKSDPDYNYDFVVFTKDMSEFNQKVLSDICNRPNVSLRFVNVKEIFENLNLYTPKHITIETYFRLIIPVFMKSYNKILFLDSDLLILEDIKNLYNFDIKDYAVAATEECLMSALLGICGEYAVKYMYETLKLKNPDKYFQAGVMIFNIDYFNEHNCSEKLMEMVLNFNYNIVDQDALNELLNDKCFWLPNEWNYPPLQKHMKEMNYLENMSDFIREKYLAVKEPKILHFADCEKPWFDPTEDYATDWWFYARKSPYYEEIMRRMCLKGVPEPPPPPLNPKMKRDLTQSHAETLKNVVQYKKNVLKYWKYKIFSNFVFGKTKDRYRHKKYVYKQKIRSVKKYFK